MRKGTAGTKTSSKRKAVPGGTRATKTEPEGKTPEPLPTAEWIAEMVMRILGDDLHPERSRARRGEKSDCFKELRQATTRSSVVANVMNIYRAAQEELARRRRVPPPIPEGLTKKERETGHVTFERGCKIITGETRRDRAEEKYIIWREWEMGQMDDWDGMPEAEEGFGLTHLAEVNARFKKYFKISLASHKRQNGGKTGQNTKKAAKPKTNAGQKKVEPGQKIRKT